MGKATNSVCADQQVYTITLLRDNLIHLPKSFLMNRISSLLFLLCIINAPAQAQKSLQELQQHFVDLSFGMFIHYNIPTYMEDDWADPEASPALFNPKAPDPEQWASAARSANMSYGCLTTKHHSGFALWDTRSTDYNVMNSPLKADVVRHFVDAFRKNNLEVMLYYSILDTHHALRPGFITPEHLDMIKTQLTELLSNYGPITALIIDGWDAPWSRISYDAISFEEIYQLIKKLQPNCLVMDLNAAKYPADALFYTDIKSYEQGAGQHISKALNQLPALSCLPLQQNWFWKPSFPNTPVKDPEKLVRENIIPLNQAHCNFILNVAPNREGKIDANALEALRKIGSLYQRPASLPLSPTLPPIISSNLAKHRPARGSWSEDMWIMDFANDDDFTTGWISNRSVKAPWLEIDLDKEQPLNLITITEDQANIQQYHIEYYASGKWMNLLNGQDRQRIKIHRFATVWASRIRLKISGFSRPPSIRELGVYFERPGLTP